MKTKTDRKQRMITYEGNHRKRRRAAFLAMLLLLSFLVSGCGTGGQTAKTESSLPAVHVGCDTYAPFSYTDVDGNLTGIDIELAREAFHRIGYEPEFEIIKWEEKKDLLNSGAIDCVWSCFTIDGREDEYRWAGPYMTSHQVIAVNPDSKIYSLEDLENKVVAVQSTTKPEDIIRSHDGTLPELRKVISVQKKDLIFLMLGKGYVDAIAAHDTAVEQFMKECDIEFRILDEPLQTVGLGVAFDKDDTRGIDTELDQALADMKADGTTEEILGKYVSDTSRYLGEE